MRFFALIVGYLIGSVSGARVVGRHVEFGSTEVTVDGVGSTATVDGVSPSMLRARRGDSAGLRAAAIDILKGAGAVLVANQLWGGDAGSWAGAGVVVGHAYPVHRRFRGGFGMSPLMGVLAVVDPVGLVATIAIGLLLGAAIGSAFAMTDVWPALVVPWMAWRGTPGALGMATIAAIVYFWRSRHETAAAWRGWRSDDRPWAARIADITDYPSYRPSVDP